MVKGIQLEKNSMKKNDFLFSIIVPVYNTEKYLEKCLKSILEAIEKDCEVIIINDGSTDNCDKIIKKFINNLPNEYKENFIYKQKKNKGLADTKNLGIEIARGEYISVVDSDDYITSDFYEIARKYTKDYDIIIYDLYIVFEEKPLWNYTSRAYNNSCGDFLTGLLNGVMSGSSCNKIIKKELYNDFKFPIGKEYEDIAVTPFILYNTEKIKYIPYPLYYYLQREKSIVSTNTIITAFYKMRKNTTEVLEKQENISKYNVLINEFYIKPILNILIQDFYKSKKEFIINIEKFSKENRTIIKYIINKNMIKTENNEYTPRQKELLEKIFEYLIKEKYKQISKLLKKREIVQYFRNVNYTFKQFIKAIIKK